MIFKKAIIIVGFSFLSILTFAQKNILIPDLSKINDTLIWTTINRNVSFDVFVHMDSKAGDGISWLNGLNFSNGTIELDIKGKDEMGKSFVGIAFHGLNDSTFDAVYFRPFNFKNSERANHSLQYVSEPTYPWKKLRDNFPGKYENKVIPTIEPEDWFHITIVIKYPSVKVFVNHSEEASLMVDQLSMRKSGKVGLWVGNNSEGNFKNLTIIQ